MEVILYKNNEDPRRVEKTLGEGKTLQGTIKEGGNLITPFLLVRGDIVDLLGYNYLSIPSFGRFYFVESVTVLTTALLSIKCTEDVLMTYKEQLKACSGRVVQSVNPENYALEKKTLDTNSVKQFQFEEPFNYDGVNVMVCVNGNKA